MLSCSNGPQVTPDIFSGTVSWFNGGQVYPPGLYSIGYITGAMRLEGDVSGWTAVLYHIVDEAGHDVAIPAAPGTQSGGYFDTQAACAAANAGYCANFYHGAAGRIGVYLDDVGSGGAPSYSDNVAGTPNPTYMLCPGSGTCQAGDVGPPPAPTLAATPQLVASVPSVLLTGH